MSDTSRNSAPVGTRAPPPFDGSHRHADIFISTADHVEFCLVKAILAIVSPFFDDMFSLVQPPKDTPSERDRIDVTEDSETFESLMRLCYPIKQCTITDFTLLEKVLEAAMKYQMEIVADLLKDTLCGFVDQKPLQCFAVACRLQLDHEMRVAAKKWKTQARLLSLSETSDPFTSTTAGRSWVPEMATLSTATYRAFLKYISEPGEGPFSLSPSPSILRIASNAPSWITIIDTADADHILRSIDGSKTFTVHSSVLRIARAEKLLEGAPSDVASTEEQQKATAVDLDGDALEAILRFCYPSSLIGPLTLDEVSLVLGAAKKLDMLQVEAAVRRQMKGFIATEPLRVYLLAAINHWTDEAQEAAAQLVVCGMHDTYVREMDLIPASVYHTFLEFRHYASRAAQNIIKERVPYASAWHTAPYQHLQTLSTSSLQALMELAGEILQYNSTFRCVCCERIVSSRICPQCSRSTAVLEKGAKIEQEIKQEIAKLQLNLDRVATKVTTARKPRRGNKHRR